MKTSNKSQISKLYTEGLEGTLQLKVKRVAAQHGDSFRTKPFQATFIEDDDSQDYIEWCEAERDTDSGLWSVYQYKTEPGVHMDDEGRFSHETGLNRKTIQSDICFFDALYCCAFFEVSEENESLGLKAINTKNINGFSNAHYKEFAQKEGILFDQKTRLPIPVGDGKILAKEECVLELNARDIVKNSKGNLKEISEQESTANKNLSSEIVPAVTKDETNELLASLNTSMVLAKNEADIKREHKKRIESLWKIERNFEIVEQAKGRQFTFAYKKQGDICKYELVGTTAQKAAVIMAIPGVILSAPWMLTAAMFTGGFGVLLHGMNALLTGAFSSNDKSNTFLSGYFNNGPALPHRRIQKNVRKLRKLAKEHPSNTVGTAYYTLANTAELGLYKLSARHAFKRASAGKGLFAERRMKNSFEQLIKCAGRLQMSEKDIKRLIDNLKADPTSSSYEEQVRRDFEKAATQLKTTLQENKHLEIKQLKALPAP